MLLHLLQRPSLLVAVILAAVLAAMVMAVLFPSFAMRIAGPGVGAPRMLFSVGSAGGVAPAPAPAPAPAVSATGAGLPPLVSTIAADVSTLPGEIQTLEAAAAADSKKLDLLGIHMPVIAVLLALIVLVVCATVLAILHVTLPSWFTDLSYVLGAGGLGVASPTAIKSS
jgi:disulfide bond formation protein DsbB